MCFFFNATATTEIYTYCHALSLHDALPICRAGSRPALVRSGLERLARVGVGGEEGLDRQLGHRDVEGRAEGGQGAEERRSEEHTSELQSLMRISYAVFCLKKKKHNNQNHKTPIAHT